MASKVSNINGSLSERYRSTETEWRCGSVNPDIEKQLRKSFGRLEILVDSSGSLPTEWEVKRYFEHMFQKYDDLDDWTIFAHPDVLEHVHFRTLNNLLQAASLGSLPEPRQRSKVLNYEKVGPPTPSSAGGKRHGLSQKRNDRTEEMNGRSEDEERYMPWELIYHNANKWSARKL